MSHTQVQWARGTTAQVAAYTGPQGELVLNTDDWSLQAQDGVAAGGWVIRPRFNLRTVTASGAQSVNITDDIIAWAPVTPAAATFTLPSSPRVGDAATTSFGLPENSRASTTFCRLPPESSRAGAAGPGVAIAYRLISSTARSRMPRKRRSGPRETDRAR